MRQRTALSLLEVILALAILALSMAAIGELIRIGTRSARAAQDMTRGQILCESKLSEIISGVQTADPVARVPFPTDPDWFYTVQLAATEEQSLMALTVTVENAVERGRPVSYSLVRWIPDPGIELPEEPEEPEEQPQSDDDDATSDDDDNSNGGNVPNGSQNGGSIPGGANNPGSSNGGSTNTNDPDKSKGSKR